MIPIKLKQLHECAVSSLGEPEHAYNLLDSKGILEGESDAGLRPMVARYAFSLSASGRRDYSFPALFRELDTALMAHSHFAHRAGNHGDHKIELLLDNDLQLQDWSIFGSRRSGSYFHTDAGMLHTVVLVLAGEQYWVVSDAEGRLEVIVLFPGLQL